jgi:hypothetical protein
MSQQRCIELEGKLQTQQQQHRLSMQTSPANMIEATRAKAIADLEQVSLLTEMTAAVFVVARRAHLLCFPSHYSACSPIVCC